MAWFRTLLFGVAVMCVLAVQEHAGARSAWVGVAFTALVVAFWVAERYREREIEFAEAERDRATRDRSDLRDAYTQLQAGNGYLTSLGNSLRAQLHAAHNEGSAQAERLRRGIANRNDQIKQLKAELAKFGPRKPRR